MVLLTLATVDRATAGVPFHPVRTGCLGRRSDTGVAGTDGAGEMPITAPAKVSWRDTVAKSPRNFRVFTDLGNAIAEDPDPDGRSDRRLSRSPPAGAAAYWKAQFNWAHALAVRGDLTGDQQHYEAAATLAPAEAAVHYNLGLTLAREGQTRGGRQPV